MSYLKVIVIAFTFRALVSGPSRPSTCPVLKPAVHPSSLVTEVPLRHAPSLSAVDRELAEALHQLALPPEEDALLVDDAHLKWINWTLSCHVTGENFELSSSFNVVH